MYHMLFTRFSAASRFLTNFYMAGPKYNSFLYFLDSIGQKEILLEVPLTACDHFCLDELTFLKNSIINAKISTLLSKCDVSNNDN